MAWLSWRGTLLGMLALVGLAVGYATLSIAQGPAGPTERTMIVQDEGDSLRCAILAEWRLADGSRAFDLRVLDTGERLTLVEDGPALPIEGASNKKALPSCIYHWGQGRDARPAGVPIPPEAPKGTAANSGSVNTSGLANTGSAGSRKVVDALPTAAKTEDGPTHVRMERGSTVKPVGPLSPAPMPAAVQAAPSAKSSRPLDSLVARRASGSQRTNWGLWPALSQPWMPWSPSYGSTDVDRYLARQKQNSSVAQAQPKEGQPKESQPAPASTGVIGKPGPKIGGDKVAQASPATAREVGRTPTASAAPTIKTPADGRFSGPSQASLPQISDAGPSLVPRTAPPTIPPIGPMQKGTPANAGLGLPTAARPALVGLPLPPPNDAVSENSTMIATLPTPDSVLPPPNAGGPQLGSPANPSSTPAGPWLPPLNRLSTSKDSPKPIAEERGPVLGPHVATSQAKPSSERGHPAAPAVSPNLRNQPAAGASGPSASTPVDRDPFSLAHSLKRASTTPAPTAVTQAVTSRPWIRPWTTAMPGSQAAAKPSPLMPTFPLGPRAAVSAPAGAPSSTPGNIARTAPAGAVPSANAIAKTQPTPLASTAAAPSAPSPQATLYPRPASESAPRIGPKPGPGPVLAQGATSMPTLGNMAATTKTSAPAKSGNIWQRLFGGGQGTSKIVTENVKPPVSQPAAGPVSKAPAASPGPSVASNAASPPASKSGSNTPVAPSVVASVQPPAGPRVPFSTSMPMQPQLTRPAAMPLAIPGSARPQTEHVVPSSPLAQLPGYPPGEGGRLSPTPMDSKPSAPPSPPTFSPSPARTLPGSPKPPVLPDSSTPASTSGNVAQLPSNLKPIPLNNDAAGKPKAVVQAPAKKDFRLWGTSDRSAKSAKEQGAKAPASNPAAAASAPPRALPPTTTSVVHATPPASLSENTRSDILMNPERVAKQAIEKVGYQAAAQPPPPPTTTGAAAKTPNETPSTPPAAAAATAKPETAAPVTAPPASDRMPLGAQSVLAARNGTAGPVSYVPVPVVTVPDPYRPPLPPAPQMPQAPQANAFVNAFSPPVNPNRNMQPGMMPQGMVPQGNAVMNNPVLQARFVPPGYGPYNPAMVPGMMSPAGYMHNPYAPQHQPQPMMPPYASGPMMPMQPMQPMPWAGPRPMAQGNYQGPQPPNPFAGQATQTQYQPPYPPAYAYPPVDPRMPTMGQAMAGNMDQAKIQYLLGVLQQSPYPAQRSWAATELTTYNWRAQPHVLQTLLLAARQDPAASVRASCVYCLGRMNASTEPVVNTLLALKSDVDPTVRQEVEQALNRLGVPQQLPPATLPPGPAQEPYRSPFGW